MSPPAELADAVRVLEVRVNRAMDALGQDERISLTLEWVAPRWHVRFALNTEHDMMSLILLDGLKDVPQGVSVILVRLFGRQVELISKKYIGEI